MCIFAEILWKSNIENCFFEHRHIIASGSADRSVILWDLDEQIPHTRIIDFNEKVQTVKFCPTEAQMLLTGCCAGTVKVFDCRDPNTANISAKMWTFAGQEIERAVWDTADTNNFFVGTNKGALYYCDIRQEGQVLWTVQAHRDEISSILPNASHKDMLSTTSADGLLKVWRYTGSEIIFVHEDELGIGRIQCGSICPDNGYTIAVGGDKKERQLRLIDTRDYDLGMASHCLRYI